jgi:apolipoprotein N-acyltransferase
LNETTSAAGSTLDAGRVTGSVLARRWLLPAVTGGLLALAYPPFNVSQLAWFGLVPLLFAVEECRPGEAFRRGYVAGLVFFALTTWWIIHVTMPGTFGLIPFLALYFGAGAAWFAFCQSLGPSPEPSPGMRGEGLGEGNAAFGGRDDTVWRNLLVAVGGSAGWVTLEWVRGKLLFGGFPWNFLGVSQWQVVPLIQFADVTGVYGVSVLVCFVNFAFYVTIRRYLRRRGAQGTGYRLSWELYLAMGLIGLALMHGVRKVFPRDPVPTRSIRVALVQGDIPQTLKFEPEQKPMILERYRALTEAALVRHPELIIWPETATPDALRYDPESFALVTNLVADSGANLLTGTIDITPDSSPPEEFNAAILVGPDGTVQGIYHKLHLVPFGEYVPLRKVFPFLKWLTPIPGSLERGHEFTVFEADGMRFGVVICFEDTIPELVRQFVLRHVDFMVNVTNDAWFKTSPAAEMHLANAVFRAVENRRPLVRATNNGITCVVSEQGSVNPNMRLAPFAPDVLVCELSVPRESGLTFYTRHGDWVVGVCAVAAGLVLAGSVRNSRKLVLVGAAREG